MYKNISMVWLAVGLSGLTHAAHSQSDDRLISRQSMLTAEQEYIIRENVKDVRGGLVTHNVTPKVGDKIPPDIELYALPSLVVEKVPQVNAFKFFVTKDQIVLVSPSNTVADVVKKP